jgi:uncharacterized protein (TIGR00251 family)
LRQEPNVDEQNRKAALISVKVLPCSSRNQVVKSDKGVWKVKITSAPVEGKANKAVREYLAKCLDIAKGRVDIVSGERSKLKTVRIEGLDQETVQGILAAHALDGD